MKAFVATKRDNERGIMRLELDGTDVEILEGLVDRLERLEKIEAALDIVAFQSPYILGHDLPTVTKEGRKLLQAIIKGWGEPYSSESEIEYEQTDD
jgi:hypothetical protein